MKMDGRDSAEWQNWEKKDIVGINEKVEMRKRTKVQIVVFFFLKKRPKREIGGGGGGGGGTCRRLYILGFRERERV